jgi:hypothetical protein
VLAWGTAKKRLLLLRQVLDIELEARLDSFKTAVFFCSRLELFSEHSVFISTLASYDMFDGVLSVCILTTRYN